MTQAWWLKKEIVEHFFVVLSGRFGKRTHDHHLRPSKVFRGLRWARSQVLIDGQDEDRRPYAPWRRSVVERLLTGYVARREKASPGYWALCTIHGLHHDNRPALETFRDWFEDRTGFREVEDVETLLQAAEGLGGTEFDVCIDIAKGFGWKVATPEPDERPLEWEWTCGKCGEHRWSAMLPGGLAMCAGCKSAWPIKK
jgi:hypothetical protein